MNKMIKFVIFYIIMSFLFSGCCSPPDYRNNIRFHNYSGYSMKYNNNFIEDESEINYQEMYFEGFNEEVEDLEYENEI